MKSQTKYGALPARLAIALAIILLLVSCGGGGSPLDRIRAQFDQYPEYSVVLQDMSESDSFFGEYDHIYRVIYATGIAGKDEKPDLQEKSFKFAVDKATYQKYESNLGMVILAKKPDGTIDTTPQPLGYEQVGNPRYGEWKTDDSGRRYWGFNNSYLPFFLGYYMGRGSGPRIYHDDYDNYRYHSQRGTPYYGPRDAGGTPRYGTSGTATKQSNPSFFERQQARMRARESSFSDRVESRMGRSQSSGFRSRGGGIGK